MAFAGVSLIADGKLCASIASPVNAGADSGYHLLVVEGYSRSTKQTAANGESVSSHRFIVGGYPWIVEYFPNGSEKGNEEFISVFLALDEDVSKGVEAQFTLSFIDQPELRVSTICRRSQTRVFSSELHGHKRFMRKEVLQMSRHLKNDSCIIRCDVVVIQADNNNTAEQGTGAITPVLTFTQQVPSSDMQSHFRNLFLTKDGADITFEVGGEKMAAHRLVLAARSTVFKSQLLDVLNEGATMPTVVKINNIEADVFRGLLAFIYTDALPFARHAGLDGNMEEDESDEEEEDSTEDDGAEIKETEVGKYTPWLLQLLEAADRYDLQKLKSICEEILASREICATSVADIIVVAERRGCRLLKEACLEFIKSHTSVHKVFTADCLDQIIRTTSPSGLKELFSKFPAS